MRLIAIALFVMILSLGSYAGNQEKSSSGQFRIKILNIRLIRPWRLWALVLRFCLQEG